MFDFPKEGDRIRVKWDGQPWQEATVLSQEIYESWHRRGSGFSFRVDDYDYNLPRYPNNSHSWTAGMSRVQWDRITPRILEYNPEQQGDTDDDI